MLLLPAFLMGTIIGLLLKRKLRPLLFERWSGLALLFLALVAALIPTVLDCYRPDILWAADRELLLSLMALTVLLSLALILLNVLPQGKLNADRPPRRWYHRAALLVTAIGLVADAAVMLLNKGYMPIPESFLTDLNDPMWIEAIRNQALRLKQLIGPETRLPWLGQIWRFDLFKQLGLTALPFISPGQAVTAAGLFLIGITNFFGQREPDGR